MLTTYLNQFAEHSSQTGTDGRGQPIYSTPTTIRCRKQAKTQQVLTATQQTITANHVYYTISEVKIGDKLDGKTVMAIDEWVGLSGAPMGYKAVL